MCTRKEGTTYTRAAVLDPGALLLTACFAVKT